MTTDDLTRAEKLADMTAEMALEADTEIEAGACRSHAALLRRLVARCREAEALASIWERRARSAGWNEETFNG